MARFFLMDTGNFAAWGNDMDNQATPVNWQQIARYDESKYAAIHQQLSDAVKHAVWGNNQLTIEGQVIIDSAWIQARENELNTAQAKAVARTLMLSDAKNYLSNQLQASNPNIQTIFNAVKAYVDSNATLSQMLTNQIAVFNIAYGVTVNPAGATAADRARYLICCQLVLGTIA